jgi:glycosyltransferase involved in cell wall biosynthesis
MRVLIDATPLQTGHRQRGVGTYTRQLLRALLTIDPVSQYRLVVHPPNGESAKEGPIGESSTLELGLFSRLPPNASLTILPRPPLGRLTAFVTHQVLLPALLAREQADLFHSPGFVAAFSVPGVPWRCPLPLVVTLHDFIPLHMPALFNNKTINRWWYGRQMGLMVKAERLICVSQATQQDAVRFLGVAGQQCVVIPEGVDRQVFTPDPAGHESPGSPFILFVGGDFPNKNRVAAVEAFARLTQASTLPHQLVLLGKDNTPITELSRRHPGLDLARIRRIQHVSHGELCQLYRTSDLLLFPSLCEGFGLPVLEAMASGTPVITSSISALPEVAGDAALLVDPYDVDAITAGMLQVLASPSLQARLRAAGLARAKVFTWEKMARRTLDVYREVTERHGRC